MKKTLILLFVCVISLHGFSIDIVDIFYLIPTNIELDTKKELVDFYDRETAQIAEIKRERTNCKDFIRVIDKANGFLSLSTNCGDAVIELCYWNTKNGEKLVVVNNYEFATSKFTQDIDFYILKKDTMLTKLESESVLPYNLIRNELLKDGLSDGLILEAKKHGLFENETIVFELPRFAKTIKARFGTDDSDNWSSSLLDKKYCELSWNNLALKIE